MKPRYSILLYNQILVEFQDKISQWLGLGIKVIWFGKQEDVSALKGRYKEFNKHFLLQAYNVSDTMSFIVIDGRDDDNYLSYIESVCPKFNVVQYQVEHCNANDHIVVQASAGTGKTTIMIDRIMYLLHTVDDLKLSEVYMITFTNDATNQMNVRLQEMLLMRYQLTHQPKYLMWLEDQSQMNISTIHSFAYTLLGRYGSNEGFTKELAIRSFTYEKKEIVKDLINDSVNNNLPLWKQIGMSFYKASSTVYDYWSRFAQLGISYDDMLKMNWGECSDKRSVGFHQLLCNTINEIDVKYMEIKKKNNAVGIDDIMRDLRQVLFSGKLPFSDLKIRYLFIDEFQDSDDAQIFVACLLVKLLDSVLFVVGDIKQSIYRFRGATDTAFILFDETMKDIKAKKPKLFTLINNYRTSADILYQLDGMFKEWTSRDLLVYDKSVVPFNTEPGEFRVLETEGKEFDGLAFCELVQDSLDNLKKYIDRNNIVPAEKHRVVVLARSNNQLAELKKLLDEAHIPASVKQDGSFFASEAVRDFYVMISSFLFANEPKYVFNYLLTPYAGSVETMNIEEMESLEGDPILLQEYISKHLGNTAWREYHKQLRLRPVMAVLKDMIDAGEVIDNYIRNVKRKKSDLNWKEESANISTMIDANRYQANLEKLLEILQRNFSENDISLYDIYHYLNVAISTNRTEPEAEMMSKDNYRSVYCMTVHKSKGLEYDTIIIPFTESPFYGRTNTEILVDKNEYKVGWLYCDKLSGEEFFKNDFYEDLRLDENVFVAREETRIFYVALTRSIRRLLCMMTSIPKENTWSELLREGGAPIE